MSAWTLVLLSSTGAIWLGMLSGVVYATRARA